MKRTPIRKVSNKKAQEKCKESKIRDKLLESCGGLCMHCGKPPDFRGLEIHHKKFKSRGGESEEDNMILICGKCHAMPHGIVEK